ncbi:MAG: MFS transporter, partial [Blautia sp.]|nr:MFS transporter [Blautia sp.]
GVDIREVTGLRQYLQNHIESLDMLRSVRISERIAEVEKTREESLVISFAFGRDETVTDQSNSVLYLEAELSDEAIAREMRNIFLVLLSTFIILLIFVFELTSLVDLIDPEPEKGVGFATASEKRVGTALRFTSFLCSTAEYLCVPYAAMMIRDSGEALFGLSVGMTSALPLTLEGLTQMCAMLFLPKLVRRLNIKKTLVVSAFLMILCNLTAFSLQGALVIVLCRAVAGIAYAGFKQVSNFLITSGYETEVGRSDNISQDNAGLLAGATCGAGLGAILSANIGYANTFFVSALVFGIYLLATVSLLPWKELSKKKQEKEEQKPMRLSDIRRMIFSPEMLFYVVVVGIPLNIGVMLCVTLIPAICQTQGISSVMLSYCYIANGIAGIYIGPALVSRASKLLGNALSVSLAFGLTAFSIFILRLPPVIIMIMITSMILGFLDGFSTPLCTDLFMSLKVVRTAVDESTALIFSVVLSYVLLTVAPVVAELFLLPGKGFFSPMMIGCLCYAVAAVLLFFYAGKKRFSREKE